MDKPTQDKINKLHPSVRDEVTEIVNECNVALKGRAKLRITQGLRTFAEQDALFKQVPKVTNAKGGESIHNYGFAVDGCLLIDGKEISWDFKKDWDADGIPEWDEVVKIFAKHAWSWGGSWASFKDLPHFDKIGFNNWRVLAKLPRDKDNYVIVKQ